MRIVHLANFYGPRSGGLRTTLHQLGAGYRDAGHEVVAVVPGERDRLQRTDFGTLHEIAAPVVPGTGGYRVILRRGAVTSLLEQLRPDRLEISDRTTLQGISRWAARRGVPAVLFAHERVDGVLGSVGVPGPLARALADRRNRAAVRDVTAVVATTAFAATEFARIAGAPLHRVPLGVDLDRHPARLAPSPGGPVRLLLCSRLSVEKRPELAVAALAALRARGVDATLTVVGDGPRRRALEQAAAGLPVTFTGFVTDRSEVARLQRAADIALAPGPIETFGLAALECLAVGTPAVVHAGSALPEVIGDDGRAGLAAAGTGAAFADAVVALLAVPEAQRRQAARNRAEQFPWSAAVARMLALHGLPVGPVAAGAAG